MKLKHVQAELEGDLYRALQAAAKKEHLTLKEALQEAAADWARRHGTLQDPLDALEGIGQGTPQASDVDKIYWED